MGCDARGRRHPSAAWLKAGAEAAPDSPPAMRRGRKLVVQIGETFGDGNVPMFVETLDAIALAEKLDLALAPVMIYADDVTHIVTEEGIANLLLCRDKDEREQAVRGVAGYTEVGRGRDKTMVERPARPRRDPAARGPRRRPARCRPQSSRRKVDQGSRTLVGRPLQTAVQIPELVEKRPWKR